MTGPPPPSVTDDHAAPALRHGAVRLVDVLAAAGGGPARPSELGESAGLGRSARSEALGELRHAGLIEGTIHAPSLTERGWELARRRQGLGGEDPGPAESPPMPRGDPPVVAVTDLPAAVPAADDASSEDSDARDLVPAPRPPAPPGDGRVDVVRAAPSVTPAHRASPDDGTSDGWGWLLAIAVPAAVWWCLWLRGRLAAAAAPVVLEEGLTPAPRGTPAPAALQARGSTDMLERLVQRERSLEGR